MTLQVTGGSLLGAASPGTDINRPDITGDVVDVIVEAGGSFAGGNRPLVVYAQSEMFLTAPGGLFPIWAFGERGPSGGLTTTSDLFDATAFGSVSDLLVDVESMESVDPAVFTEVRNYSFDHISILMPRDQLYDDQQEDEEADENYDIIL